MTPFEERVRKLQESVIESGYEITYIAAIARLHPNTIHNIVRAKTTPSMKTVVKIENALKRKRG